MLNAGEVIGKARGYLDIVMPEFAALKPQVEEMVFLKDKLTWKITFLAKIEEKRNAESLAELLSRQTIEKVVDVGAEDGALIAVRNSNPIPF